MILSYAGTSKNTLSQHYARQSGIGRYYGSYDAEPINNQRLLARWEKPVRASWKTRSAVKASVSYRPCPFLQVCVPNYVIIFAFTFMFNRPEAIFETFSSLIEEEYTPHPRDSLWNALSCVHPPYPSSLPTSHHHDGMS